MAMSGVKVNDECVKMWEQLKMKKIKGMVNLATIYTLKE